MRTLVFVGLFLPSLAVAQSPSLAVLPTRASKLSMDETRKIDAKIAEIARKRGFDVKQVSFELADVTCREIDCLPAIAVRYKLDVVAAAEVTREVGVNVDVVRMIVFRQSAPNALQREEEACESCDGTAAVQRAQSLAMRVVHVDLVARGAVAMPEPSVPPGKKALRAVGWVGVGLALGGIGMAAGFGATHNHCSNAPDCTKHYDNIGGIAGGAVLAAVGIIAVGVGHGLGYKREPSKQARWQIVPSLAPGAVGVVGAGNF